MKKILETIFDVLKFLLQVFPLIIEFLGKKKDKDKDNNPPLDDRVEVSDDDFPDPK